MFPDRWAREECATVRKVVLNSASNIEPHFDPIVNIIKGAQGTGSTPPTMPLNGHPKSSAIPPSRGIPVRASGHGSESDMDICSESDDDIYKGQYSLDTSPQDDRVARATAWSKKGTAWGKFESGTATDNLSDSPTSTGISFSQISDGYPPSFTSQANSGMASKQGVHDRSQQDRNSSHFDIPSAPPMSFGEDIKISEKVSTYRANATPQSAYSDFYMPNDKTKALNHIHYGNNVHNGTSNGTFDPSERVAASKEVEASRSSLAAHLPTFHASGLGPWCAVISYDACVRLCLHSWARGCKEEAPYFLNNECAVLRNAFGLEKVLLQPEEEILAKQTSELVSQAAATKSKKTSCKIKVQVRKVKMGLDPPAGCNFSTLNSSLTKLKPLQRQISNLNSSLYSGWVAVRKVHVTPQIPANSSLSQQSLAYVRASGQYIKQVSMLLRNGITTMRNTPSTYEAVQETYSCLLRLKSSPEEESIRMQPGSGESHVFFPDSQGDDLILEVQDSKGRYCGRVVAQVAVIADDPSDKLRWWPIYYEPEHELAGRIQLFINYSTTFDESNQTKCGIVAETVAYDFVLEVAMKVQHFQQRSLLLHGQWKWLVTEFASYYGVSDVYTKLRYLSYVMDVATPTKDCLDLVYDLLRPVLMKGNRKSVLSHQENRILGEVEDQIQQILALVIENYKSLDESLLCGMNDVFSPATGMVAPALPSSVKLYILLHDVLSPEAQLKLCKYIQAATRKRSRRYVADIDESISSSEGRVIDPVAFSTSYQKMRSLILNVKSEVYADIEIHNHHVFPSFVDLPNLSASIYSVDLSSRLRAFLVACPPPGPSSPVAELVIATADFQRDLSSWNISHIKGGVDAKELFHPYITCWIHDKHLSLLDMCKPDKVELPGVKIQQPTTPFVDEMYGQLKETMNEYEVIISRWPDYITVLEKAIADVEKAIIDSLDKQYAHVLSPLKDSLAPKMFGLKYVHKFAKGTGEIYFVPDELGILLNSMKRMLDTLRPKIESHFKTWASFFPDGPNSAAGECLTEITVMLRSKFRNYLQAVVEKLAENTKMDNSTKLKRIIQDSRETVAESDLRTRMEALRDVLVKTIDHVHSVAEPHVFIAICRGFWDRMGQEVLHFLQNKGENRSCYKGSRLAVSILDDIFGSQMQQLLGNSLQEKDVEPPRSIMEARSILCKDAVSHQDNNYYY